MKTVTKLVGIITVLAVIGLMTGCPTDGSSGSSRTLGNIRKIELRTSLAVKENYSGYAIEDDGPNLVFEMRDEAANLPVVGSHVVILYYYDNSKNWTHTISGISGSQAMHIYVYTNGETLSDLGITNEQTYVNNFGNIPKSSDFGTPPVNTITISKDDIALYYQKLR